MLGRFEMKIRSLIRTRAGFLAFGTVAFGSGMVVVTHVSFHRMWDISFPGTLIPIVACYLVGLCWAVGTWQFIGKSHLWWRRKNDA
jgi:hypothetical protein